jgi:hypothetical protein
MAAICFFDFAPERVKAEFTEQPELRSWHVLMGGIDDLVEQVYKRPV